MDEEQRWWLAPSPVDAGGLSNVDAEAALRTHGPNAIEAEVSRSVFVELLSRFRNPLVLILLFASVVSAATGDVANFVIIGVIVVMSVVLDFVQERRATRAAASLRASVALTARTLRDARWSEVPVIDLVPGDVVALSAGDRVPADGRLVEANGLFANEGLLTGESYPAEKRTGDLPAEATEVHCASNAVFMGSSIVSGSGTFLVVATGRATALGAIAHDVQATPPPTAFERDLHRFGVMILRVTILLVLFALLVNLMLHRPPLDAFLFAVALAVGLTPELLPMVVSVTLSRGSLRMAARRVIVKRLPSLQNLGAMDVFCTDKTGTLTQAAMALSLCVGADGRDAPSARALAALNSAFQAGLASPLDTAILASCDRAGHDAWRKIDEIPFDFKRRRVAVVLEREGRRTLVAKGAADQMLALCTRVASVDTDGKATADLPLDDARRAALRLRCEAFERDGLRVLAVARRDVTDLAEGSARDAERDLVFEGFLAFVDPPKEGAAAALTALADAGIAVKIVSGDSELVNRHLCALLDLPVEGVLTGQDLAAMDDAALRARVERTTLFCRVDPIQKNRIVLAYKARGHVVGYLGDGVNDAPPIRSADVGLTVDTAVEVAREVADMVMLDRDLAVLHDGVLEGRRTFGNVTKYILMGTSSNFGNMVSMAVASLFLPFLPLLPTQILLNNVLYDLSELAIPLDRVDAEDLARPRRFELSVIRRFMWVFGAISSVFDGLTFLLLMRVLDATPALFRTGWFIESLVTQVLVIFVIRTRRAPWASKPSGVLTALSLAVVAIALWLPWAPFAHWIPLEPPPLRFYAWLAGMAGAYLAVAEIAKRAFYAKHARRT